MAPLLQPQPAGFVDHQFELVVEVPHPVASVWQWLNTPETFTDTQVPPYKVEFYSPNEATIPNGFHEGVLNIHHGPFLCFAGVLTTIQPETYRDLQYYYGSYAFSLRWVRPYRLQFWVTELEPGKTQVKLAVSSWVKPWTHKLWSRLQRLFWGRFKGWMTRSVKKLPAVAA